MPPPGVAAHDVTPDLRALWESGRKNQGKAAAGTAAASKPTPPKAAAAQQGTELRALKDLQNVVNRVRREVDGVCRDGLRSTGSDSGTSGKVIVVSRMLSDTRGKVQEMLTHFRAAEETAAKRASAGRLIGALLSFQKTPTTPSQYGMYSVVSEVLLAELEEADSQLFSLAQTLRTQQQMQQQCADHREGIVLRRRKRLENKLQQAEQPSRTHHTGSPTASASRRQDGSGGAAQPEGAGGGIAAANYAVQNVNEITKATAKMLDPAAMGHHLNKLFGTPAGEAGNADGGAAERAASRSMHRRGEGAGRSGGGGGGGGGGSLPVGVGEESEEHGGGDDARASMSNEALLATLKDEAYDMEEIQEKVQEIATMSEVINAHLSYQADQVREIDQHARDTRGGVDAAQKSLQKASEQKYSWKLLLAITVFILANSLVLIHMIRP